MGTIGTNYYVVRNRPTTAEPYHIGKSSMGWMFHFQTQNEKWDDPPVVWNTYKQLKDWLIKHTVESNEFVIMDEYDRIVTFDDFIELVEAKQKTGKDNPENFDYARNVDGYRFSDQEFS